MHQRQITLERGNRDVNQSYILFLASLKFKQTRDSLSSLPQTVGLFSTPSPLPPPPFPHPPNPQL